jgi:hypothetical protein
LPKTPGIANFGKAQSFAKVTERIVLYTQLKLCSLGGIS